MFAIAGNSRWRNSRLLLLGYHGLSLHDEHLWDGSMYLSPELFRRRLEALKRAQCNVLPLHDALHLLAAGQLPPRSVVLTFDDGNYDFYKVTWQILKEFGFPATLFLTTYYVDQRVPVVPGIWRYLLWKRTHDRVDLHTILDTTAEFDISTPAARAEVLGQLTQLADRQNLCGEQRECISAQLAKALGLDYQAITQSKIAQLLQPDEVRQLAREGASIQMHMHQHRSPSTREEYLQNLDVNRCRIRELTGVEPKHFCYPSGRYSPEYAAWLREVGVSSATTCSAGLASKDSDMLAIPRFIDTSFKSELVFESWLLGLSSWIPRRPRLFQK